MDLIQHEIATTEKATVSYSMEDPNTLNDSTPFSKLEDLSHLADNNDSNNSDKETDIGSFVVLGKDSMDAIQASSLASYVDIQQKSMLVDYNSMVSSMATNEIHQKLSNLLQENTKLKETLKQNNLAMKKQLTTMVSWQEIVVKLHANHMEKFKEAANVINDLKKENLELKTKLAIQSENIEHNSQKISNNIDDNSTLMLKPVSQELEASVSSTFEKEVSSSDQKSTPAMSQTEVTKCNNSKKISNNIDDNNTSMLKPVSQELEASVSPTFEEEASSSDQKSTPAMSQTEVIKCNLRKRNLDIRQELKKEGLVFEDVVMQYMECKNSILKTEPESLFPMLTDHLVHISRQISEMSSMYNINICMAESVYWNDIDYENNRMRYNNLLSDLVGKIKSIFHIEINVIRHLKFITDLLAEIEKVFNEETLKINSELLKNVLVKYKAAKYLLDQMRILNTIPTIADALKDMLEHIRNVFTDYRQNLNMIYLMMDETSKMTDTRDIVNDFHNNSQNRIEVLQKLNILTIQQSKLLKQEEDYEYRRQDLEDRIIDLNSSYRSLNDEKNRIQKVDEELKRRKNLYDGKVRALLNEKLSLMRYKEIDPTDLLEKYEQKNIECEKLQRELDQTISEINVYKNQIALYEEDFKQEKNMKESLLQEKNKLDMELQKQVNYNKQLTSNLSPTRSIERFPSLLNKEVMPPCPKCERAFPTLQSLTEHIEQCLNLD